MTENEKSLAQIKATNEVLNPSPRVLNLVEETLLGTLRAELRTCRDPVRVHALVVHCRKLRGIPEAGMFEKKETSAK